MRVGYRPQRARGSLSSSARLAPGWLLDAAVRSRYSVDAAGSPARLPTAIIRTAAAVPGIAPTCAEVLQLIAKRHVGRSARGSATAGCVHAQHLHQLVAAPGRRQRAAAGRPAPGRHRGSAQRGRRRWHVRAAPAPARVRRAACTSARGSRSASTGATPPERATRRPPVAHAQRQHQHQLVAGTRPAPARAAAGRSAPGRRRGSARRGRWRSTAGW